MSSQAATFPIPVNPESRRLESVDLLRGLLMLLMAIDHSRDFFSSVSGVDPTDPTQSWPALFATRWITHLCAPGFVALAGASVYLQRQRGKTAAQTAKLLATRGLWLIFLEFTVISFGWSFAFAPGLQVIWAIGFAMLFLAALQRLPTIVIGCIGAAIVLVHNLFDRFTPSPGLMIPRPGSLDVLWIFLHHSGIIFFHGHPVAFVLYPIVPWIGIIALGYAFGAVVILSPERRRKVASSLGFSFLLIFTGLRIFHGYGDPIPFHHLPTEAQTAMSFFEVLKYPPSLQYVLATLGVLLLLYTLFDLAVSRSWLHKLRGIVEIYGRVPFFYYVLHIYFLHLGALLLTAAEGKNWHFWLQPAAVFTDHLAGWGFNLPGVYLAWFILVTLLYFPCKWFAAVKARRRDWWLSYL